MTETLALLNLAGLIALLLWGLHMVQTGIQRAFGPSLRRLLGIALSNRGKAFCVGVLVTAGLQSSTATALMISSFSAAGLVDLVPALAVMLGANVGTTLIVQAMAFDVHQAAPILVLIGFLLFRRKATSRARDLGRVAIGLGLMLFALGALMAVIALPKTETPMLRLLLDAVTNDPLIAALLAALLAWATHSSVVVVLLIMSFVAHGVLPLPVAFALVLGANLGTAINPLLEVPAGSDAAARRLPAANLVSRLLGCAVALVLIDQITPLISRLDADPARTVANFHTAFTLVLALALLPVLGPWASLLRRLLPGKPTPGDPSLPLYLHAKADDSPAVRLACAVREGLRMADTLQVMLEGAIESLEKGDRDRIAATKQLDTVLDRLHAAIATYLGQLDPQSLAQNESRRVAEILTFTKNFEDAGDIIEKNLMVLARKRLKNGFSPSTAECDEVHRLVQRLIENVRTAAAAFMGEDFRTARRLVSEKEVFRELEADAANAHFACVREGRLDAIKTAALQLDVLRDLRRINAHVVAATTPLLERRGELLPSRLRQQA